MPVQNLFLSTLIANIERKTANQAVIRGAWHLAVRSKDVTAMSAIAGAENLPDDVLAAVKARNEIPVAVAYLTRDGLSPEERKARLEAENRAGVLAGVLESASVTDADREVLTAKLITKPTRALAEATISDANMPLRAVVVAVAQLDHRLDQLTDTQRSNMRRQVERCAQDADSAKALSEILSQESLAGRFLVKHPVLDEKEFENIFRRAIVPGLKGYIDRQRNSVNVHRIVGDVKRIVGEDGAYHSTVVLNILRELLEPEELSRVWTEVVGATRALADTSDVSDHSARVLAARQSADTEQLDELIADALSGNGALVEPLLSNMALSHEQLLGLLKGVDDRTVARLTELRPGDVQAALVAYTRCFDRVAGSDNWKAFPDRRAAETAVLNSLVDSWRVERSGWYSGLAGTLMSLISQLQNTDLLGEVPWGFYVEVGQRYGVERLGQAVAELQAEYLGDDVRKWETAQVLAEGFSGSLRELFSAAAKL